VPAAKCTTLHHAETDCNRLQQTATHWNRRQQNVQICQVTHCNTLQHTATHCNTLQHTATHCIALHHTAPHLKTPDSSVSVRFFRLAEREWFHFPALMLGSPVFLLRFIVKHIVTHIVTHCYTASHCDTLEQTATHCHTVTHCNKMLKLFLFFGVQCNTLQHTIAYCSRLQHTATTCNPAHHQQQRASNALDKVHTSKTNQNEFVWYTAYIYIHTYIYHTNSCV